MPNLHHLSCSWFSVLSFLNYSLWIPIRRTTSAFSELKFCAVLLNYYFQYCLIQSNLSSKLFTVIPPVINVSHLFYNLNLIYLFTQKGEEYCVHIWNTLLNTKEGLTNSMRVKNLLCFDRCWQPLGVSVTVVDSLFNFLSWWFIVFSYSVSFILFYYWNKFLNFNIFWSYSSPAPSPSI